MQGYSTEGLKWSFIFTFNKIEFTGTGQKGWYDDIPIFIASWKQKDDPGAPYNGPLYPHRGNSTTWTCDLPIPQDMIDAVGKAIEETVSGAGFDIYAPPSPR